MNNIFSTDAGKAQANVGLSLTAFLASLSFGLVIFIIQLILFLLLKDKFTNIYLPRTYLVSKREKTKKPPISLWRWVLPVFKTPNTEYIQKCGLDAYFFLQYLRTLIKIFLPLTFVLLPILLPINLIHGRGSHFTEDRANFSAWTNVTGLDQLSWTNVPPTKNNRLWAHLILAVSVVIYTCYVLYDELRGYVRLRQAYLTSPQHRIRASATTVLVTAIPQKWCTQEALDGLYNIFPGGIRNIFINRNYNNLSDKIKIRNNYTEALEAAETKLIQDVNKAYKKRSRNRDNSFWHHYFSCFMQSSNLHQAEVKAEHRDQNLQTEIYSDEMINVSPVWKYYLEEKDRDTMRLPLWNFQWMPSLPLVGKKVDTIEFCRTEIARLNVEIEQDQGKPKQFPLMYSAFIQFNNQIAAHMACQSVSHHVPNQMSSRFVEIAPGDIIWDNMSIRWWESYIRKGVILVLFIGILIGWAIPVTATGLISQIEYLTSISWLTWLIKIPKWMLGAIQGILPQALLSLLLLLVPIILRFLARTQGAHTGMAVELAVQNYYFFFLFLQVFLVVSISSGITTVLKEILTGPQSIASVLGSNLPKASNYFFSYILLQALSVSAGALLQVSKLFFWFIWGPIFDKTARQKWGRQTKLSYMQWGTFFPFYTNLAAIGLIYSVISPLILVFLIISFSLFWVAYRYNTLYVTQFHNDTGGLLYPQAINQLFIGLYFMEVCLIGLFLLAREMDVKGNAVGLPCKSQAIIMFIVFLFTVLFQWLMNSAFAPLFHYLPITLEDEAVICDEKFARTQDKKWRLRQKEAPNNKFMKEDKGADNVEMKDVSNYKMHGKLSSRSLRNFAPDDVDNLDLGNTQKVLQHRCTTDIESQRSYVNPISEALFSGLNDQLEDLTLRERHTLMKEAFKHRALRAKRPVIWIPRDHLGVSNDEIRQTQQFSENIWISNQHCELDAKARVIYKGNPPDFSEADLIEL